ncbi:hypothetical protein BDV06DRAFT_178268 [Aspergillus oleicola]
MRKLIQLCAIFVANASISSGCTFIQKSFEVVENMMVPDRSINHLHSMYNTFVIHGTAPGSPLKTVATTVETENLWFLSNSPRSR